MTATELHRFQHDHEGIAREWLAMVIYERRWTVLLRTKRSKCKSTDFRQRVADRSLEEAEDIVRWASKRNLDAKSIGHGSWVDFVEDVHWRATELLARAEEVEE